MKGELKFGNLILGEWITNKSINPTGPDYVLYRFSLKSGEYGVDEHCVALFSKGFDDPWLDFRNKLKHLGAFHDQIGLNANDSIPVQQDKVDEFLIRMSKLEAFG